MKPVLSVKEIYCGYQNTEVLHGISFDVFSNEKICIIGPNGCGKTTLLRAICRIIPYEGTIIACDKNIAGVKRKDIAKKIAYMSQMNGIYFPYSVYDTVRMGRYAHDRSTEDEKIAEDSMKQTGTWELRDRMLTELSGGQLQRVMLARVFAQSPDIIMLDEPTNHLDLKYQIELMEYLNKWVKQGNRCIVSVLHDFNMAFSFADRILLMDSGRCVSYTSKETFSLEEINRLYEMDVCEYMQKSLDFWKKGK